MTDPPRNLAPVEVHILTYNRDHLSAIWALKSFYHFAGVRYPLVIHLEGQPSARTRRRLRQHFPNAQIVLPAEANAVVEKWLDDRGLARLKEARRNNIMMMKLIDFVLIGQAVNVLTIDSDILFFAKPTELLVESAEPLPVVFFQHDHASSYNITPEQALAEVGVKLIPQLNAGLRLFARASLDLARCDQYLANPVLAYETEDQSLHALWASERGIAAYLPDKYLISLHPSDQLDRVVARHYAGPSRALLTEEGMPKLIRMGFLEQTRTRS